MKLAAIYATVALIDMYLAYVSHPPATAFFKFGAIGFSIAAVLRYFAETTK